MKTRTTLLMLCFGIYASLFAADEITLVGSLIASKGNANVREQPNAITVTWNGTKSIQDVINAGSTPQALIAGSVVTNGYAFFRNTSTNMTVFIGFRGSQITGDLQLAAGEFAFVRLATNVLVTNMYVWTTTTTNADLYYRILEN